VTHPAVTTEIHETLDVHRNLSPQIALYGHFCNHIAQLRDLGLGEVLDLDCGVNAGYLAGNFGPAPANPIDMRKRDDHVLIYGNIYTGNTCHGRLPLSLFVPPVDADHPHNTVASDDLAVTADSLNGCPYFHGRFPLYCPDRP
jgi:hypothetical protein